MIKKNLMVILDIKQATPRWTRYLTHLVLEGYKIDLVINRSGRIELEEKILSSDNFNLIHPFFMSLYGRSRLVSKILRIMSPEAKNSNDYLSIYEKFAARMLHRTARKLLLKRKYDTVITSSSPFYCHIVAMQLRKEFEFDWIADYRDLWSLNHASLGIDNQKIEFEKKVLAEADACITVSEGFRKDLRKLYSGPIHVIFNGYEKCYVTEKIEQHETCVIEYTGQIYKNFHGYVSALEAFEDASRVSRQKFVLNFSGTSGFFIKNYYSTTKRKMPPYIKNIGFISHSKVIERQRNADFVLFFNWEASVDKGVILSKIYEYISSGVPILIYGDTFNSEVKKIYLRAGHFIQLTNSIEVGQFFSDYAAGNLKIPPRNEKFIHSFMYREQAKTLYSIIENPAMERVSVEL